MKNKSTLAESPLEAKRNQVFGSRNTLSTVTARRNRAPANEPKFWLSMRLGGFDQNNREATVYKTKATTWITVEISSDS